MKYAWCVKGPLTNERRPIKTTNKRRNFKDSKCICRQSVVFNSIGLKLHSKTGNLYSVKCTFYYKVNPYGESYTGAFIE